MVAAPIALLFPGQGSQRAGMLTALRGDAGVRAILEVAEGLLGRRLDQLDSATTLAGTQGAQLALLIAGVATAGLLASRGIAPAFVAGHSVGAFAAAVHAGVMSFADALKLVRLRGEAMARAFPQGYGMIALTGVPESTLEDWIAAARQRGAVLYLANRNAARQFSVSGKDEDLAALIEYAHARGIAKAVRLKVPVPSHSPLMASVAATMRAAMGEAILSDARIPYAANRNARVVTEAQAIAQDLAEGVAHPVFWHDMMQALYERGARMFIEVAPGEVLTRLIRNDFSDAHAYALDTAGLDALATLAGR